MAGCLALVILFFAWLLICSMISAFLGLSTEAGMILGSIVTAITGVAVFKHQAKEEEKKKNLLHEGKAAYFVKIAASGKGSVYHTLNCGRCLSYYEITVEEARNKGYVPCSLCGGIGTFKTIK